MAKRLATLPILLFSAFSPSSFAQLVPPTISVNGTVVTTETSATSPAGVVISSGAPTRTYYTIDGSTPSFASTKYGGPFNLTNSARLQAIAYDANFNPSPIRDVIVNLVPGFKLVVTGYAAHLTVQPSKSLYPSNTIVTLKISDLAGWRFKKWSGYVDNTNDPLQITMRSNMVVKVILETDLTLRSVGGGTVSSDRNSPLEAGSYVKLTAFPDTGNYFVSWDGLDYTEAPQEGSPALHKITSPDHTVTALFAPLPQNFYALNLTSDGPGLFSVSPPGRHFTNGTQVTITANPMPGGRFLRWTGDVESTNETISVTLDSSKKMNAEFEDMVKWVLPLPIFPIPLAGPPSVGPDGTIYICSNSNLVAIAPTPQIKWVAPFPFTPRNLPIVGDNGDIFVTGKNGSASAFSPDGTLVWQYLTLAPDNGGDFYDSSAALGPDNTIYYFSGNSGQLLAVTNGAVKWSLPLRGANVIIGFDGKIYTAAPNTNVVGSIIHAISPEGTIKKSFSYPDNPPRFTINTENILAAVNPSAITLLNPDLSAKWQIAAPPSAIRNKELIFTEDFNPLYYYLDRNYRARLSMLSDANLESLWTYMFDVADPAIQNQSITATSSGEILALDGTTKLITISSSGQRTSWAPLLTPQPYAPVLTSDGDLLIASHANAWHRDEGPHLAAFRTSYHPANSGWPMFGANAQHTYRATPPKLTLSITPAPAAGEITISASPPPGTTYSLDLSTNLASWNSITTFQGLFTTNLTTTGSSGFYRLKQN